jgi:hypothetical protein
LFREKTLLKFQDLGKVLIKTEISKDTVESIFGNKEIKKTIIWYIDKFNKNFFKNKNFMNRIGLKV